MNPVTKADAEALAFKREKHKSKHLDHKHWTAVHDPVKGWHAALVNNHVAIATMEAEAALDDARDAFRAGDMEAFLDAGAKALLARCRADNAKEK